MTLATLLAVGWRRETAATREALALGMLLVIMMMTSPVCHLHYFPWLIPLISAIVWFRWERGASLYLGVGGAALIALNNVLHSLAHMRHLDRWLWLRDMGFCSYPGLALWTVGLVLLIRERHALGAERLDDAVISPAGPIPN
ncbi:MAG: hypothetical protein K2R98_23550 [Gemmataceae bacterium]|nr:hypothetical protein [Gemmataceae bacterium]